MISTLEFDTTLYDTCKHRRVCISTNLRLWSIGQTVPRWQTAAQTVWWTDSNTDKHPDLQSPWCPTLTEIERWREIQREKEQKHPSITFCDFKCNIFPTLWTCHVSLSYLSDDRVRRQSLPTGSRSYHWRAADSRWAQTLGTCREPQTATRPVSPPPPQTEEEINVWISKSKTKKGKKKKKRFLEEFCALCTSDWHFFVSSWYTIDKLINSENHQHMYQ